MEPLRLLSNDSDECIETNETIELITRSRAADDDERTLLEEQVIRRYQPMTRRLAHQHAGHGWDADDLTQVANMALLKAIRRFDAERGSFESYAKATISGELKNHLRDHSWSIRPPRRVQELQWQIHRSTEDLAQTAGALPEPSDVAHHLGTPLCAVTEAMAARSCHSPTSLDQPVGQSGRPLGESLGADEDCFEQVDGHLTLVQICNDLSDDDRNLIRLRFYEGLSQREIAEEIGVSQMQVSRRLASLLERLRAKAAESLVA